MRGSASSGASPGVIGNTGVMDPGAEPARLDSDLVRAASVPASNEVIDAALRLVVELAAATVDGANGASVSLERHGKLRTVAASNDTVLEMDLHQYEFGEGPCVAAAAEGHEFHIEVLSEETRWPTFVPEAVKQGIKSILSTPLIPSDKPMGALNIYSDAERAFGASQMELAQLFATQASGILADAGAEISDDEVGARIGDALRSREVIARAQGVLMARTGVSENEAASALHAVNVVASTRSTGRADDGPRGG